MNSTEGNMKGRIEAILYVAGDAVDMRDLERALDMQEKELTALKEMLMERYTIR